MSGYWYDYWRTYPATAVGMRHWCLGQPSMHSKLAVMVFEPGSRACWKSVPKETQAFMICEVESK